MLAATLQVRLVGVERAAAESHATVAGPPAGPQQRQPLRLRLQQSLLRRHRIKRTLFFAFLG